MTLAGWLHAGAVAVGMGAAVATGQGLATASPASEDAGSSDTQTSERQRHSGSERHSGPMRFDASDTIAAGARDGGDGDSGGGRVPHTRHTRPVVRLGQAEPADAARTPNIRSIVALRVLPAVSAPNPQVAGAPARSDRAMFAPSTPRATLAASTEARAVEPAIGAPVTVRSMVADVLTWIGLGPLAAHVPVPPLGVPPLVETLWLSIRRMQFTVNNQRPGARPTTALLNPYSGLTGGDLNAVDYEGDPLTYTLDREPRQGTVVINPDGTFTYRPSETLAVLGGTDSFVVTIDDQAGNPPHSYGLLGALGLLGPTTVRVTVRIAPIDQSARTLVAQAHDDFATALRRRTEADEHAAQAETEQNQAGQLRDAAAAILANNPDPQMKADAAEMIELAQQHEARAGAQRELETIARQEALTSYQRGADRIAQALALDPDIDVGQVPDWDDPVAPATIDVGTLPVAVAFNASGTRAYVANNRYSEIGYVEPASVSVIDTAANAVIATVELAGEFPGGLAVSPDGTRVYVSMGDRHGVLVIDTTTNAVVGEIETGGFPLGIAMSPDGTRVYVGGDETVSAIDVASNTVVGSFAVGDGPHHFAVSPDGRFVYVGRSRSHLVSVIDTQTGTVSTLPNVGSYPYGVAISPDGTTLYVITSYELGAIAVIDTATRAIVDTVVVGGSPMGVAVSPDGSTVYAVDHSLDGDGTVWVFDTATATLADSVFAGEGPTAVAVSPDGSWILVTNYWDGTASVIPVGPHVAAA